MSRSFRHLVFLILKEYLTDQLKHSTYGNEQLHVLRVHFGEEFLDYVALEQEWIYLKQLLTDSFKSLSTREVLEMILKDQSLKTLPPQITRMCGCSIDNTCINSQL